MTKWELNSYTCSVGNKKFEKDKKTGKTQWDDIVELASQGWELVSVTSITNDGSTIGLTHTFKRPIEDGR